MFERLVSSLDHDITHRIFKVQVQISPDQLQALQQQQQQTVIQKTAQKQLSNQAVKQSSSKRKLGRNDPCWCGSGKKWKRCHWPEKG
jgi:preprotein translocase subunit SecA